MKYSYQARDAKGGKQVGTIEASSKEAALEVLSNNNLFPLDIVEVGEKAPGQGLNFKIHLFEGVSQKDVASFSRELAIMIDSNVPPAEAIEALGNQSRNKSFKEKVFRIATDVRGGTLLSKAFGKYPDIFSVFYVNMIRSGEVSGNLPKILGKVADHLESEDAIRSKTLGAMIYPLVILIVFVLIFIIMMIFVVPGLVAVLKSSGRAADRDQDHNRDIRCGRALLVHSIGCHPRPGRFLHLLSEDREGQGFFRQRIDTLADLGQLSEEPVRDAPCGKLFHLDLGRRSHSRSPGSRFRPHRQ